MIRLAGLLAVAVGLSTLSLTSPRGGVFANTDRCCSSCLLQVAIGREPSAIAADPRPRGEQNAQNLENAALVEQPAQA
jgi:hypothetical protein